jgi:hypothetical protein
VYEEVQRGGIGTGAYVTYPVATLPADAMDTLFVGADVLQRGADVARQYARWTQERRLPQNVIEGEVLPALPAPRNVPQPVEDEDLF